MSRKALAAEMVRTVCRSPFNGNSRTNGLKKSTEENDTVEAGTEEEDSGREGCVNDVEVTKEYWLFKVDKSKHLTRLWART